MSTLPDNEFDLEKLFLPAWAQEPSASKYAKYEGGEERSDRRGDRDRRGPRPPRRDGPPGPRRDDNRPRGEGRGSFRPQGDRRGPPGGDRPDFRRGEPRERREAPPPLPEINLSLVPDEKGVESLARQIRMTGRAYPLFDIAQMILQKPERHTVVFSVKKNAEGQPVQPLFVCALDDTLWLSEDEAVAHVLRKHFATFYLAERTATEPPKGKYTFVAQCGMSGIILGPPNHHDYQNQLRKLHTERFSRMPFEVYKSRVRIVRDEEVVKKWVDDQSWRTEYVCLNLPEPLRLGSMEAVEKHFRETHKENIIKADRVPHTQWRRGARFAQPRPGAPGAQRLGRPAPVPAPDRDRPEPAIRRAWPAILQGQQDRHACVRRAAAVPGFGGHTGVRGRETDRGLHQREPQVQPPATGRSPGAVPCARTAPSARGNPSRGPARAFRR